MLRVQPDQVTPLDMERAARWMGGWMQPRRGSEAEARRPSFCAPSTHPPTPPLLQALYMVAVAKPPGIAAGVGPEERRTPIAMGLRYATQFGDGSPFKSGDAYERMCACARLSPPPPKPACLTMAAQLPHAQHTCTTHHAPAPRTMHNAQCTLHAPLCHALTLIQVAQRGARRPGTTLYPLLDRH